MKLTSMRRIAAPTAALALGLSLAACGAANEEAAPSGDGGGEGGTSLSGTLNGAGSSAQEAAMAAWQAGFQQANPEVTVNYDPIGSGGGREQFIAGGTAFGGSDSYLSEEDGEVEGATERCGGETIEIPNYVSPIAVIFNVEGVDELQLDPETVAGIFAGEITSWDDPAIADSNPEADLPSAPITAVHRADESGTTENFTAYLDAVAPDTWTYGEVGEWPFNGGEAAPQTSGVVSAVTNGTNTVGYADASQANDLGVATVRVGEDYVEPSAEAASRILEVSPRVEGRGENSMAFELDRSTTEGGAYPIVLTSYLMACPNYPDQETADLVKGFLTYVISDEGQEAAAESAGSAPLSDSLQEEAQGIVDKISAQG